MNNGWPDWIAILLLLLLGIVLLAVALTGCNSAMLSTARGLTPRVYRSEEYGACVVSGVQTERILITGHACYRRYDSDAGAP